MAFRPGSRSAALKKKRKKARRANEAGKMRGQKIDPSAIDYKDVAFLQRMVTAQGKMFSRKRSGLDAACQRALKIAVKRARFLALMPHIA